MMEIVTLKKLQKAQLLQQCPEEWIQNKMPGVKSTENSDYFIFEGKRRELKEFDLKSKTDVAYDIVNFVKNKH